MTKQSAEEADEYFIPSPKTSRNVLHPYLGVMPYGPTKEDIYGFGNTLSPIQKRGSDKFIIGFLGGSVARQFFDSSIDFFAKKLESIPALQGKEIISIRLAGDGYKQPQQLMTLNYFMSLGAEFDLLINIDGFNEVALPLAENIPKDVFPAYPRNWYFKMQAAQAGPGARDLAKVAFLMGVYDQVVIFRDGTFLRNSATFFLTSHLIERVLAREIRRTREKAVRLEIESLSYRTTGPPREFQETEEALVFITKLWLRCSILLGRIARSNGIRYIHVLQPNQYVPNSKKLTAWERAHAFVADHPYREGVDQGYQILRELGRDLSDYDVEFIDMTMLFKNYSETIYADNCCHYNRRGYEMMAERLAVAVAENLLKSNREVAA